MPRSNTRPRPNAKTRKYKNRMKKGRKTMRGGVTSSQRERIKNARAFWKQGATIKPVEKGVRSSLQALKEINLAKRRSKFTVGKKQGLSIGEVLPSEYLPTPERIPEKKSSSHYVELAAPTSASKKSVNLPRSPSPRESEVEEIIVPEKTASQIKREENEARKAERAARIKENAAKRAALPKEPVEEVVEISSSERKRRNQQKEDEQKEAELKALEEAAKKMKEEADAKKEINIQQQKEAAELLAELDAYLYKETNPSIKDRLKKLKKNITNFFRITRKVRGQKSNSATRRMRRSDPTQPHRQGETVQNPIFKKNSSE